MTDKAYLLDTGVFIEAHRRYWYRLDLNPGFWDALLHYQSQDRLRSLDRCRAEISEGDALAAWVADAPAELFVTTAEAEVAAKYAEVMAWADAAEYTAAAKATFASGADGWLVAYGAVHGLTVVTHETYQVDKPSNVKVPNACEAFEVDCVDTFVMLRELEVQFNWQEPQA